MVYSKEERNKHWEKILEKFFDKEKCEALVTTKDLKSVIQDKEIRLLNYFDSEDTMPEALKRNQIMLFPNTTKSWWLIKCDGFVELKSINDKPIEFKSKAQFKLHSASAGMGEQQYVLNMVNSGILGDFLQIRKPFYFCVMGKQRAKTFQLSINGHNLTIEKPAIEIDAGFEGEDFAIIIEAKAKLLKKISKRQIYFPYIHLKTITKKRTIPVFFCWDKNTKTYNLWRFEIENDSIDKIKVVDSRRYVLKEFDNI